MYSDYIVRGQILSDLLTKYSDDTYLSEQLELLQSLENEQLYKKGEVELILGSPKKSWHLKI